MYLRIPAVLQKTIQTLALKGWVNRKSFPRDAYFLSVESFIEAVSSVSPSDEINPVPIVAMLAAMLDEEGALATYVITKTKEPIAANSDWDKQFQAAGWAILQRYEREVDNGKWAPVDD